MTVAVPVWLQNAAFAVADRWCRVFYRKGWVEMPCRRCGEPRFNHTFGRIARGRGC